MAKNTQSSGSLAAATANIETTGRSGFGTLLILAIGTFAVGTDAFVLSALMPAMARDLNSSVPKVGQIMTLFAVTYAVSAPIIAALTAPWPRKRLLLLAQTVFVIGMLMQALGTNIEIVAGGRMVAAVGAAGYTAAATAVAATLVPAASRGQALAIVMGGFTVATMFGVPLGSLLGGLVGWRWTLSLVAMVGALAALGALRLPEVRVPVAGLTERMAALKLPGVPSTLLTTVATLAGGFTMYTYLPALIAPALQGSTATLSVVLLLYGTAGALGNVVAGKLTDRVGPLAVLRVGIAGIGLAGLLMPLLRADLYGVLAIVCVWSFCGWATGVPQQYRLMTAAPQVPTVVLGWNASANYAGISIGAMLGGALLAWTDVAWLGPAAAVCALLALLLTWLQAPARREAAQS
ncbi:MAG: MFS transporter [Burkholderiaceae bacterium]